MIRTYGYKPRSQWTTAPVFQKAQGYSYYHNDHLGTPQKLIGAAGGTLWSSTYSAFGLAQIDVGATVNPRRFSGQHYDSETGLHYNYARYYEPASGRYITSDPVGLAGGLNRFTYVLNDPVNVTDPIGLTPSTCPKSEEDIKRKPGWCRDTAVTGVLHFPPFGDDESCYRSDGSPSTHCCYKNGELSGEHVDATNPTICRLRCCASSRGGTKGDVGTT